MGLGAVALAGAGNVQALVRMPGLQDGPDAASERAPLLVGAAVTVPLMDLGALALAGAGNVQTLVRMLGPKREPAAVTIDLVPLLVGGAAVTCPLMDLGAVALAGAGNIQAFVRMPYPQREPVAAGGLCRDPEQLVGAFMTFPLMELGAIRFAGAGNVQAIYPNFLLTKENQPPLRGTMRHNLSCPALHGHWTTLPPFCLLSPATPKHILVPRLPRLNHRPCLLDDLELLIKVRRIAIPAMSLGALILVARLVEAPTAVLDLEGHDNVVPERTRADVGPAAFADAVPEPMFGRLC